MADHVLHQAVGNLLEEVWCNLPEQRKRNCILIKDQACVEGLSTNYVRIAQNIPLFASDEKGNDTEYCNVDALLLVSGAIKVIVEIEESALDPTQVCGKFLTSALAKCYIHRADGGTPIYKADGVLFVQVMKTSRLKEKSKKRAQWKNLEGSIQGTLPLGGISRYRLLFGEVADFAATQATGNELAGAVRAVLEN